MRIKSFQIKNFKGICDTTIPICDGAPGSISTLVGLNESGKTTVLEAIAEFITEDKITSRVIDAVHQRSTIQDFIPKDKKASFTGDVTITANVEIEGSDISALSSNLKKQHNFDVDVESFPAIIEVTRVYKFVNSDYQNTQTQWKLNFQIKSSRAKLFTPCNGTNSNVNIWHHAINILSNRLPKIVYFPTFLFEFPDRIYVGNTDDPKDIYFSQIIQDVLDSIPGENYDINTHIIDRIERAKRDNGEYLPFWMFLNSAPAKKQIDAVLRKVAARMGEVIFGAWHGIMDKRVSGKRLNINWAIDGDRDDAPYLEISMIDGVEEYNLSERSLGFRWFFSFLLFTYFRQNRIGDGGTIFLFDEPAANLHSAAQSKLLESFSKIAQHNIQIIYSTHSHYMINPLWLERACIIRNEALDYESDVDLTGFVSVNSDIKAIPYKTFLALHPSKTSYFQPVLDALEVPVSPLERTSRAIIVEGKFDYHPFTWLARKCSPGRDAYGIFPGNGAGHLAPLIALFRGWGVSFVVILDDDDAGRRAKKSYMKDFLLSETEVATIGEISSAFEGKSFEAVFQDDVKNAVLSFREKADVGKRDYALFFQHLVCSNQEFEAPLTETAFKPISDWTNHKFCGPTS
jgi:predicted ATPase